MESTMEGETPPQLQQRCSELWNLAQGYVKDGSDGSDVSSAKLGLDCLMDTFVTLFDECQQDCFSRNKNVAAFVKKYKEVVKKTKALRIKASDFEVKATIGRGHFGEVHVVHEKTTDTVYAMKVLRKTDLLSQPDISFFEEERDIMAGCLSPWLTRLHFAFQDNHSLYLVMDFHPGGDLLSLLSRHGDQLEEDMARFYLAEMAVAINSLHHMGYLHRDIKPENVLLDHSGHIKLADFGSAAKMDSNKKVSSRMPVGTPDYVAPELLDSMNRASRSQRYGVEVDWWSLGVCAYEMLFGCTPFTDENGSMVGTYNNIMNYQKKLKFPSGSEVSQEARDLISGLLSDSKSRLGFPQLTQHPFFSSVSWDTIRNSTPPYVPSISSLDDTSNFDEVEKSKAPPNVDSFQPHSRDFSGRHLPFVGFTFARCAAHQPPQRSPKKSASGSSTAVASMLSDELDSSVGLNTARYNLSHVESSTSLQPPHMHTQMDASGGGEVVRELRARCCQLEGRLDSLEAQKAALEKELQGYVARNKGLTQQLEQEQQQVESENRQSVDSWQDLQTMNAQITSLEDQMLSFQLDELRDIIVQLDTEQESLTQRLLQKDRHIDTLEKSLATAQQQLAAKQLKLDRERRKSREGQRQHMALFETHEDTWSKQLEEKQETLNELTRKVRDLEDLVRAYEEQEEEQAGELQQLHYKLNTSLAPQGLDSTHLDLNSSTTAHMQLTPASPRHSKKVSLHVTLKPGQHSVRDNKTAEKLKELQSLVDLYSKEASSWRTKEDSLLKKVAKLEGELQSHQQKEGVSQQTKESLMSKVHVYQQEVRMQRKLIQELQKKMRSYLNDQTTLTHTEAKLKDLQCQNLDLEGELFSVKQVAEQTRQSCMDKTREMEDIIAKLETARRQVQEYQNKYSKEVENTDIKTRELERQVGSMEEERRGLAEQVKSLLDQVESLQGLVDEGAAQVASLTERNAQLQRQLQDYTQRNATLLRQVESVQKEHKEEEETDATTRAELHTQVNRLQQSNDDLRQQLQASQRQRRELDDKVMTLQRDAERLTRKVGRLEGVESEKRQLETRLESLGQLEREKKRLELKLSRLEDAEQDRAQLQLKVERLEVTVRSHELELQTARQEKQEAEEKMSSLLTQLQEQQDRQETQQAPHSPQSPQATQPQQQLQQSPASRKLMLDLLRSEKEELERQVTELQHINVSAKEMREELEAKEQEVKDLKSSIKTLESKAEEEEREVADLKVKVRSLESEIKQHRDSDKREQTAAWRLREDAEKKDTEISALQRKVRTLEREIREAEKKNGETTSDLRAKVAALQDQVKDNERKLKESSSSSSGSSSSGSDLRAKVRAFEGQAKSCSGGEAQDREKASLSALSAELRDLRSQLRMKTSAVERLETEKEDLQKQMKEKSRAETSGARKGVLERAASVEGRQGQLVERLQSEKAELQRQLERMEKERDSLRLATPGRLRGSGGSERDSISVLRGEGGSKIRAELEDKVQRLERVVRELEKKLEISSASSVDKHTLRSEIEQLKQQIKETAQVQAQVVPQAQYDTLQDTHHKVLEQVATLQTKVQQLTEDKSRLEKTSQSQDSQRRNLEARVKDLEAENQQLSDGKGRVTSLEKEKAELTGRLEDLQQQLQALEGQLADEKRRAREELNKLKAEKASSSSSSSSLSLSSSSSSGHRLVGDLTQEKLALESKVKSLERQLESQQSRRQEEKTQAVRQLQEEKAQLTTQVQELTAQLDTLRKDKEQLAQGQSTSRATAAENTQLRQQKEELQKQVEGLLAQSSELKKEVASSIQTQTEAEAKIESLELQVKDLMSDSSKLRQEVSRLEAAAKEERAEKEEACAKGADDADDSPQGEELRQDNAYLRTKVEELERHLERANTRPSSRANMSRDAVVAELRQELHESNLAVSEVRSLLSAAKRQETELREKVERLQRALDNGAVMRASNIQMAHGADQELRVLRSQYDTLQRQYKNLEERQNGSHRDRAATVMEITLLKDQLQTKQQQLEVEIKKTKRMGALSMELDEQIKDFEAIVADYEKKEAQWTQMGQQLEKKLSEKDQELMNANQRLQALSSSRVSVDARVGQLSQELQSLHSQHRQEVARLTTQIREERDCAQHMAAKIASFDEKERGYQEVLEVQGQNIRAENEVINELKEDLSAKMTEVQDLKTTNLKLRKHLDQAMDKFELIFGEKVSLENFTEALQGLHFLEKYKFESTIGQQMKLIDYLQELYMENAGKKKKGAAKRFGSQKGREGGVGLGVPLQWTDLTTALDLEQKKTVKLQEQLDRLREENFAQANELLKLRGPLKEKIDNKPPTHTHTSGALTPQKQQAALNTLMRSPSAQTTEPHANGNGNSMTPSLRSQAGRRGAGGSQFYHVGSRAPGLGLGPQQRMHHNIPHRFVTGLNTRATKCGLCLGSVHFVKQASKCQECGMVVHPKCTSSVPATCGLPTEYVRHFADMMFRIEEAELDSTLDPVSIKMEGWLKVPRTGKPGWEKRWVELDGSCLLLYREDTDANPVDTFDLCPPDAEVSVHSAVTAAELTGTASLDLYYVLRLDQDPLTTCWPGRYLYLMTTNFSDKQRWVAALEAAVRSMQRRDRLVKNEPHMLTVVSLKDSDRKEFNCALALSPQLVLLGTDDGLFALNPQSTSGRLHLVQLSGFGSVHQMAEAKGVNIILILTGPERRMVMVESKLIQCRMSQTVGGESTPFSYKAVEGIQRCTVFDVALWNNGSYLLCGTPDRLMLLKYNPSLAMYCIRKEMPSSQPCSCICMAESFAIVGTERFYRISLEHPSLIDFVDRQDSSLAFAAFGAANHHSFPLAVVQVSPEGLPLEFLLCFHEFGVFVDHRGQRSRQSDIKWSGLPLSFSYTEPFLYITYFNSVQATVVPTDKDQVKGCQTAVDLPAPRYLGKAEDGGAIYIASSGNGITEVILLRARDVRGELPESDTDDDKENFTSRQVRFAPSPDKGYGSSFQVKTSVSLLSLDSISSGSTFTSVESTL